jgi:hypothetical protein
MRSNVETGDRIEITYPDDYCDWLRAGDMVTVDYVIPSYGKIICKLDRPRGPHKSCCLYDSQYGYYWRLA